MIVSFPINFIMAVAICTLNVNGIAEHHKRLKVFKHLLDQHFDIYLLQETHLSDVTQGEQWEKEWGGRALWSPVTNRSAGVGFSIRGPQLTLLAIISTRTAGS